MAKAGDLATSAAPLQLLSLTDGQLRAVAEYLPIQDIGSVLAVSADLHRRTESPLLWRELLRRDFLSSAEASRVLPAELKARYKHHTSNHRDELRAEWQRKQEAEDAHIAFMTARRPWLLFVPRRLYQDSWTTQQVDTLGWWVFWAMCTAAVSWACVWEGSVWGGLGACAYVLRMMMAHMCFAPGLLWLGFVLYRRQGGQLRLANALARRIHNARVRGVIARAIRNDALDVIHKRLSVGTAALGACGHFVGLWPHAPWLLQVLLLLCKDLLLPARWLMWLYFAWTALRSMCHPGADLGERRLVRRCLGALSLALVLECVVQGIAWHSGSLPCFAASLRHAWMGAQCVLTAAMLFMLYVCVLFALRVFWAALSPREWVQRAVDRCTSFPRVCASAPTATAPPRPTLRDLRDPCNYALVAFIAMLLSNAAVAVLHLVRVTDAQQTPHLFASPLVLVEACMRGVCAALDASLFVSATVGVVAKLWTGIGLGQAVQATGSWDFNASYLLPAWLFASRFVLTALSKQLQYEGSFSMDPAAYM